MNLKSAGHERIDALFVQSATGLTSEGGTVTLHGLAESTVYFADRPRREVGHMRSSSFIELWDVGVHSFAHRPAERGALIPRRRVMPLTTSLSSCTTRGLPEAS